MKISKDQENIQRIYEGFNMNSQQPSDNLANSQHPNNDAKNSNGHWGGMTTSEKPDRLTPRHENEEYDDYPDDIPVNVELRVGDIFLTGRTADTSVVYRVTDFPDDGNVTIQQCGGSQPWHSPVTISKLDNVILTCDVYRRV
jgi:hypothetical protein